MEPWANSVMDDISATISPMREELFFAFIISIYRKYAYYIIIRVARGELFLPGWDSAVRAKGRGSAASEERGFAGVGEALYAARDRC